MTHLLMSSYNIKCDINDQSMLRPTNSLVSATTHNNSYTIKTEMLTLPLPLYTILQIVQWMK